MKFNLTDTFKEEKLKAVLIGLLSVFVLTAMTVFFVLYKSADYTNKRNDLVTHTYQVLDEIAQENVYFRETQAAANLFFVITRDELELDYYVSKRKALDNFKDIYELIQDNPEQIKRIQRIEELMKDRFSRYESTIWFLKHDKVEYDKRLQSGVGLSISKDIADNFSTASQIEQTLLAKRVALYEQGKKFLNLFLGLLFILVFLLFLIAFFITKELINIQEREKYFTVLNKTLEDEVAKKTAELVAANKELESFSYSVSHDLRAPLRAIEGFTNIISEDYSSKLDDGGKKLLRNVIDNVQRMTQLIKDLLDFSKVGRQELVRFDTNISGLFANVVDEIKSGYEKEYTVIIEDLGFDRVDVPMFKQVAVNLISNAFKFSSKKDKPHIHIGTKMKGEQKIYYIRDNGEGFSMQFYSKLFGMFQRLHSEAEFSGTGVGLSIVQRVIHKHGGKVWAESMVNKGSTFYFTIGH